MTALSEWLGRVVAVVLLASLVDLLLPNQTMQRYVRLVGGLLVLLALASPLLSWFRSDFLDELSAEMQSVKLQARADDGELARIEENARKLGEAQSRQAAQLATAQLKQEMRAAVEQAGLGEVRSLDVAAEPDGGGLRVSGVELTLEASAGSAASGAGGAEAGASSGQGGAADAAGSDAAGSDAPIADVEPVAPVDIRIGAAAEDGQDGAVGSDGADGEAAPAFSGDAAPRQPADGRTEGQVASLLAAQFGVAPDRVRVWVETDGSAD